MISSIVRRYDLGVIIAVTLACVVLGVQSEARRMQSCTVNTCHNSATNVTGPTLTPLMNHTGTCTYDNVVIPSVVADDTFVKKTTAGTLRQGAAASLTGECIRRGCSGSHCDTYPSVFRIITEVPLSYYDPNGNPPAANFLLDFLGSPANQQSIDSRIAGTTSGPVSRSPSIEGTWSFRYWVDSLATPCDIQPTVNPEKQMAVNVWACKPEWWIENQNNIRMPETGEITINVPLGMDLA